MTSTLITVPMKDPAASKTRLAHAISGRERVRLAQLLFRRTLTFLTPFAAEDGIELAVVLTGFVSSRPISQRLTPVISRACWPQPMR